jgi:hypothetical protein
MNSSGAMKTRKEAKVTKRSVYSAELVEKVVKHMIRMKSAAKAQGSNLKDFQLVNNLNNTMEELQGKRVSASSVSRWINKRTKKASGLSNMKPGVKVDEEFELDVISQLMNTQITSDGNMEIADCAFNYDSFKIAAQQIKQQQKYMNDARIQKLQLSDKWVFGLKKRYELRKRRCTTTVKANPAVEEALGDSSSDDIDSNNDENESSGCH